MPPRCDADPRHSAVYRIRLTWSALTIQSDRACCAWVSVMARSCLENIKPSIATGTPVGRSAPLWLQEMILLVFRPGDRGRTKTWRELMNTLLRQRGYRHGQSGALSTT